LSQQRCGCRQRALDLARPLGRLDGDEVRVIHERLARTHQLDLGGMVEERAQELVADLPK
jgi:hypothetical protein